MRLNMTVESTVSGFNKANRVTFHFFSHETHSQGENELPC